MKKLLKKLRVAPLAVGGVLAASMIFYKKAVLSNSPQQRKYELKSLNPVEISNILANSLSYYNTLIFPEDSVDEKVIEEISEITGFLSLYKLPPGESKEVIAINKRGDYMTFNPSSDYNTLLRFFHPPSLVKEEQEFDNMIELLNGNDKLLLSFIPEKTVYESKISSIEDKDNFEKGRLKDIESLENSFAKLSYNFKGNNVAFFVLRDKSLASSLNISEEDIGEVYSVSLSAPSNHYSVSLRLPKANVAIKKLVKEDFGESPWDYIVAKTAFSPLNIVETESQLENYLRLMKGSLAYTQEKKIKAMIACPNGEDEKAMRKLSKVAEENGIFVISSLNSKLLQAYVSFSF